MKRRAAKRASTNFCGIEYVLRERPEISKNESWDRLLPHLKDWNNGQGIDPLDWVACSGNFDLAIGYTTLFWPDFVEHDDMVLLSSRLNEKLDGITSCLEKLLNHLHLLDTHYAGCPGATPEKLEFLGKTIREMWAAKLSQDFPGVRFAVEFFGNSSSDLSDYQLTFHKIRD
ncbi:MAG TPA: hypothetical protein VIF39_13530 [Hyphomicrobium sp.]|jgi:hypothetical protein